MVWGGPGWTDVPHESKGRSGCRSLQCGPQDVRPRGAGVQAAPQTGQSLQRRRTGGRRALHACAEQRAASVRAVGGAAVRSAVGCVAVGVAIEGLAHGGLQGRRGEGNNAGRLAGRLAGLEDGGAGGRWRQRWQRRSAAGVRCHAPPCLRCCLLPCCLPRTRLRQARGRHGRDVRAGGVRRRVGVPRQRLGQRLGLLGGADPGLRAGLWGTGRSEAWRAEALGACGRWWEARGHGRTAPCTHSPPTTSSSRPFSGPCRSRRGRPRGRPAPRCTRGAPGCSWK